VAAAHHRRVTAIDRAGALALALVIAGLGFIPLTGIPGAPEDPFAATRVRDWAQGFALVALGAAALGIVARRSAWARFEQPASRLGAWWRDHPVAFTAAVTAAAFAWYVVIAWGVFSARPLMIDELTQAWQARLLAAGRLWTTVPPHPEFTAQLHLLDLDGRRFAQFPVGGPAMLALGELVRAPWLVGPTFGALGVAAFAGALHRVERGTATGAWALVLFATAPFAAFMAGSHMNHTTTLAWLCVALCGVVWATAAEPEEGAPGGAADDPPPRVRVLAGLVTGLGLGVAAAIRPVDGFAFALPAGGWLLWRARRGGAGLGALLASGVGIALPLAALLWANTQTTGAPLRFAYEVLWGESHALGFHQAPWGMLHTPARGLALLGAYAMRLQDRLFELPIPSLVGVLGTLVLARRARPFDRYLAASAALLCGLYWAYWHDGNYLGPRFVHPLLPALVLATARLPRAVRARFGVIASRGAVHGITVAALLGAVTQFPLRWTIYQNGLWSSRVDYDAAARDAGVRGAVVLVRESWGAQLAVRMWALGVSRSWTETIYRTTDACVLEGAITALEARGARGADAERALAARTADSAALVRSPFSPDVTEMYRPGTRYTGRCAQRVLEDRQGTQHHPPLTLTRDDNIYVRDLHGRDTLILARYPDRPVWLMRRSGVEVTARPLYFPVHRESLWTAARQR
jgi:hypothetical protein